MTIMKEPLTKRKELKLSEKDSKEISMAARYAGSNESAFIRSAALEKAHALLKYEKETILNTEDWVNFTNTLATYKKPTKELKQNMKKFLGSYKHDI